MNIKTLNHEGILTITIHRPEVLNALNYQVLSDLKEELLKAKEDPSVRVIVITGEGEKSFVAGADISEFIPITDRQEAKNLSLHGQIVFTLIEDIPKPVLASINGFALGGGFELALACDIRFASEKARFAFPEVKLGILPGYGGTQRASRLIGRGMTLFHMYTGDMISAEEARQLGLVEKVYPHEKLMDSVYEYARKLMQLPPLSLAAIKDSVVKGTEVHISEGLAMEAEHLSNLMISQDGKEGAKAFLEKRKPEFSGK